MKDRSSLRFSRVGATLLLLLTSACGPSTRPDHPERVITEIKGEGCFPRGLFVDRKLSRMQRGVLERCTVLGGDLVLSGRVRQETLRELRRIERVKGSLRVHNTRYLNSLGGLDGLRQIDRDLVLTNNQRLRSLHGLGLVQIVRGTLKVEGNWNLTSLRGFDELQQVGRDVVIRRNNQLNSLKGMSRLHTIKGELSVQSNRKLRVADGFNALEHIHRALVFEDNHVLRKLQGFRALESVRWAVRLRRLPSLRRVRFGDRLQATGGLILSDLPTLREVRARLRHIHGKLYIQNAPRLGTPGWLLDLELVGGTFTVRGPIGFPAKCVARALKDEDIARGPVWVKKARPSIRIATIAEAEAFARLECARLDGDLSIAFSNIKTIPDLGVERVKGALVIQGNAKLRSLRGLRALEQVGGALIIAGNPALQTLEGLDGVKKARQVVLRSNASLLDARALKNLSGELDGFIAMDLPRLRLLPAKTGVRTLRGDLLVERAPALEQIDAFNHLEDMHGNIVLVDLPALRSASLGRVRRIGGHVLVGEAARLRAVSMPKLQHVGGDVRVWKAGLKRPGWRALTSVRGTIKRDDTRRPLDWLNGAGS